jgi:hypothetical protein
MAKQWYGYKWCRPYSKDIEDEDKNFATEQESLAAELLEVKRAAVRAEEPITQSSNHLETCEALQEIAQAPGKKVEEELRVHEAQAAAEAARSSAEIAEVDLGITTSEQKGIEEANARDAAERAEEEAEQQAGPGRYCPKPQPTIGGPGAHSMGVNYPYRNFRFPL